MTNGAASQIVALLDACFPSMRLPPESAVLFTQEIALLQDADTGLDAARLIARQGDRFPSIAEFRRVYRSVNESRPRTRAELEEGPRYSVVPEWVHVWWWMRHTLNDYRWLPQQEDTDGSAETLTAAEFEELAAGWRAAGSPRIKSVREVLPA